MSDLNCKAKKVGNGMQEYTNGSSQNQNPSKISRVSLEKGSAYSGREANEFFVIPPNSIPPYPDLEFHSDHFCQSTDVTNDEIFNPGSNIESSRSTQKKMYPKLPFGLEITAGPGSQRSNGEKSQKSALLPSETLLASASFLRSYLIPSQGKKNNDSDSPDGDDTVKDKFLGLWHNLKYGWSTNIKTNFSKETPIYMLGKIYHKTFHDGQIYRGLHCSNIDGFKIDFSDHGWMTYRRKFPPLPESSLTTDCGWGCMIRSGQMMMLTALKRHFIPYNYRLNTEDVHISWSIRQRLTKMFCDDSSAFCPFSIHNLVKHGLKLNKSAGQWYGPSCIAYMMKDALEEGSKHIPSLNRMAVFVAQDGAVYIQDVLDMCSVDACVCPKKICHESILEDSANSRDYSSYAKAQEALAGISGGMDTASTSTYFHKNRGDSKIEASNSTGSSHEPRDCKAPSCRYFPHEISNAKTIISSSVGFPQELGDPKAVASTSVGFPQELGDPKAVPSTSIGFPQEPSYRLLTKGTRTNLDRPLEEFVVLPNETGSPLDYYFNRINSLCDNEERETTVFKQACQSNEADASSKNNPPSPSANSANESSSCKVCQGWKSCVILIPVRLGGTSLNPIYNNCIYSLFLHDLCIGVIGGRPKHSLYFVGFQDNSLIHLDPHFNQDAVQYSDEAFPLSSYQCFSPRKVNISKIDPSATIGFYCHTRKQFYRLMEEAAVIANANDGNIDSPIFEFIDGRSDFVNKWCSVDSNLNGGVSRNSSHSQFEFDAEELNL